MQACRHKRTVTPVHCFCPICGAPAILQLLGKLGFSLSRSVLTDYDVKRFFHQFGTSPQALISQPFGVIEAQTDGVPLPPQSAACLCDCGCASGCRS